VIKIHKEYPGTATPAKKLNQPSTDQCFGTTKHLAVQHDGQELNIQLKQKFKE
jgi:hypothetical protein